MLKTNKKRSILNKILNKKFTNVSELHKKLFEYGIKYENITTSMKKTFYLLRIDNKNCVYELRVDDNKCVYLTR